MRHYLVVVLRLELVALALMQGQLPQMKKMEALLLVLERVEVALVIMAVLGGLEAMAAAVVALLATQRFVAEVMVVWVFL